uniref:Uncharacterized protein n=1 Tax=Cannabis sativa TaxID=3483 RepID=A0A803Q7H6_CANSA
MSPSTMEVVLLESSIPVILIPPLVDLPVSSRIIETFACLSSPCLAIVPYQPLSVPLPSSPPPPQVDQKPRTFQGKAPPLSKIDSHFKSISGSSNVSKRVTRSSKKKSMPHISPTSSPNLVPSASPPNCPKSQPIGPPHPPSKVFVKSKGKEKVSSPFEKATVPKRKILVNPTYQPSPKKAKNTYVPEKPISTIDPSTIQYFVDASKASVYQRWFGVHELLFEYIVILEDFPEFHAFLNTRKWVHTVSNLLAPHPILIR